ncbi:GNAT family N-acetyltransferase [Halococcus hamelinensis]|uniref:GCN5-related N-acetyltransferase n=1 Tax=Halococcus hamelinensis 100A6 TaxID=1132509 RepID=M0M2N0_9EURY|nr:GNAT family N-acetyltransferase [Halococcus hamelinensis]EMA38869.1 GCN5-related N-acetyltransferase [Halococcus hamelinensis 100A6]
MFPDRIETERLVLERLCHENLDLFEFYAICSDADGPEAMDEVTRYMPWEPHETLLESKEYIDGVEERWEEGEAAGYVIRPRDDESDEVPSASESASGEYGDPRDGAGEYAGNAALHIDWDRRTGRLGTWLRKRFWGRGYSGERAGALMKLAFERLDLEVVSVSHHADNDRSRRAIEKYVEAYGGRREGLLRNWLPHGDEVSDEYRYTISQAEYRDATE